MRADGSTPQASTLQAGGSDVSGSDVSGSDVSGEWGGLFSNAPIEWVQETVGLGHPLPFRVMALLGDTWGVLFAVGLAFWLFGRRALYTVAAAAALAAATKLLFNLLFSLPRPEGPGIVVYERIKVTSFPSGHVFQPTVMWGVLAVHRWIALWGAVLVVAVVGLTRLYLGVHYVGDVLAGAVFGAVFVGLAAKADAPVRRWLADRGRVFYGVAAAVALAASAGWLLTLSEDPRRYEVAGIVVGAVAGLVLEARFVRFRPSGGVRWALVRALVGTVGLASFTLWDRFLHEAALWPGTAAALLATLWVVLGAPALFARWQPATPVAAEG